MPACAAYSSALGDSPLGDSALWLTWRFERLAQAKAAAAAVTSVLKDEFEGHLRYFPVKKRWLWRAGQGSRAEPARHSIAATLRAQQGHSQGEEGGDCAERGGMAGVLKEPMKTSLLLLLNTPVIS